MPANTMVTTLRLPAGLHAWATKKAKADARTFPEFVRLTLERIKHDEDQAKRIGKIKQLGA